MPGTDAVGAGNHRKHAQSRLLLIARLWRRLTRQTILRQFGSNWCSRIGDGREERRKGHSNIDASELRNESSVW
jgi:hypothetical protein